MDINNQIKEIETHINFAIMALNECTKYEKISINRHNTIEENSDNLNWFEFKANALKSMATALILIQTLSEKLEMEKEG